jgi:ribonucleoside-diphosphate reductase alpha chain
MKIARHYTTTLAQLPFSEWDPSQIEKQFTWKSFRVSIKEGQRTILEGEVEAPANWTQQAVTIFAHKYLRRAGVPTATVPVPECTAPGVPRWLQPKQPALGAKLGAEDSARQVFRRLAGMWTHEAFVGGYLVSPQAPDPNSLPARADGTIDSSLFEPFERAREENARTFYDETFFMLASQMAAPNSPQFFNTGLWWAYGLDGHTSSPSYRAPYIGADAEEIHEAYRYPQTSACFILGLRDSLLGEGGILDTVAREARIFKYGSGSGVNYSSLRAKGAPLSNGGTSSGLMSFLKLFDINAGTIKSGGTTRRAARMAIVDTDHPEAETFAAWKAKEEVKVAAMVLGANTARPTADLLRTEALASISAASFEGEAYSTVSGQNANNSLRAYDDFMNIIDGKTTIPTMTPSHGKSAMQMESTKVHLDALKLWSTACQAAWACGDPGFQFHDTINKWHTIPKHSAIRASNPCSEYMFIDNSSCNLASLNLVKFWSDGFEDDGTGHTKISAKRFDAEGFAYACKLWALILDVSVGMSSFPDPLVAENSVNYRAIGLGYANLGGLLMLVGVPYDSEEARAYAGLVTAILHGAAWNQSVSLASDNELGPFHQFGDHSDDVRRVRSLHRDAASALAKGRVAADIRAGGTGHPFADCLGWVTDNWFLEPTTGELGKLDAFAACPIRNAQLTLLAPTGTIGLAMGCDSTGIEPIYMLTSLKKLAGGGELHQEVGLLREALRGLGYSDSDCHDILTYVQGVGRMSIATPHIRREHIPVFDCAGDIVVDGHLGMMAAVQPFLSGAISKTVNLPSTATVEDVSSTYIKAWKLGLKAVALYRDGCKLSQPLSAVPAAPVANQQLAAQDAPLAAVAFPPSQSSNTPAIATTSVAVATISGMPPKGAVTPRYKLPARRGGFTQKVDIGGQSLYLRTGEYPDGRLGEIFLTMGREGSTMKHLLDSLAITMSLGLQHGVPLAEYVDAFSDSRSEPNGIVRGSDHIRMCSSIMDYLVRELAASYMHLETNIPIAVQAPEPSSRAPANVTVMIPSTDPAVLSKVEGLTKLLQTPSTEDTAMSVLGATEAVSVGMRTLSRPKYSGNACTQCGSFTLRRSGTCHVCDTCGETSGCS